MHFNFNILIVVWHLLSVKKELYLDFITQFKKKNSLDFRIKLIKRKFKWVEDTTWTYRRIGLLYWKVGDIVVLLLLMDGTSDARLAAILFFNMKWNSDTSNDAMNQCRTGLTVHIYDKQFKKRIRKMLEDAFKYRVGYTRLNEYSPLTNVTLME